MPSGRALNEIGSIDSQGGIDVPELDEVKARLNEVERKTEIILEAISLNHVRVNDECVPSCWSCRVEESIKNLMTAKRIMGEPT